MSIEPRPAEVELVLLLSSPSLSAQEVPRLLDLLDAPLDWNLVLGALAVHRTGGVAWHNVVRHAIQYRQTLRSSYHLKALRVVAAGQLALASEQLTRTKRLQQQLDGAGIRSAVLKGAAVSLMAYPDLSMRAFHDNDLLVDRARLPDVVTQLEQMGYVQGSWDYSSQSIRPASRRQVLHMAMHSHQTYSYMQPAPESLLLECHRVDLHLSVDLMTGNRSDDAVESLLGRSIALGGLTVIEPTDMLIFSCVHFAREAAHRNEVLAGKDLVLYKLVDVIALLAKTGGEMLVQRAEQLGFVREVQMTLFAANRIFPGRVDARLIPNEAAVATYMDEVYEGTDVIHRWTSSFIARLFDTRRYLELEGDLSIAVPGVSEPSRPR